MNNLTNNDIITYATMRKLAMLVAEFWTSNVRPVPFDAVFILNGSRVRISIDEYKTADDTQPVRRVVDEDERIAD